ncbi:MAG: YbhB/YbcL family Raf kinase inhibitor-like protein [Patescibacteria group bacterium]|nr:YbhB/YbcL family Raf kinase inhibitor-like protein [Patescibacteria group bacterium]
MLTLTSSAFAENGTIPGRYTCDGANTNPELSVANVPAAAKSLALIMDDPDIPESVKAARGIDVFDHWVVFNMPPTTAHLAASSTPPGIEGKNGAGGVGYTGPCPPDREHRYFFTLYALDAMLPLPSGATKQEVQAAMAGHVIESAGLVGRYNRLQNAQ